MTEPVRFYQCSGCLRACAVVYTPFKNDDAENVWPSVCLVDHEFDTMWALFRVGELEE